LSTLMRGGSGEVSAAILAPIQSIFQKEEWFHEDQVASYVILLALIVHRIHHNLEFSNSAKSRLQSLKNRFRFAEVNDPRYQQIRLMVQIGWKLTQPIAKQVLSLVEDCHSDVEIAKRTISNLIFCF